MGRASSVVEQIVRYRSTSLLTNNPNNLFFLDLRFAHSSLSSCFVKRQLYTPHVQRQTSRHPGVSSKIQVSSHLCKDKSTGIWLFQQLFQFDATDDERASALFSHAWTRPRAAVATPNSAHTRTVARRHEHVRRNAPRPGATRYGDHTRFFCVYECTHGAYVHTAED